MSKEAIHRNSLYQLTEGVYFVSGIKRGAICDTNTENVYSVNESAGRVILGQVVDEEFSSQLLASGLTSKEKPTTVSREKNKFGLEFVWFEIISDDCNERCLHCYADSIPSTYRKVIGMDKIPVVETSVGQKLTANEWKKLIDEAYRLGTSRCQFIGGEPFLWRGENKENVLDLAEYAKNVGYEFIEIFTNGTLISERGIERIKNLGLNIAISLYSDRADIHDAITRTPGSFKKTEKTLRLLKEAKIPTRVETVLMKQNQETAESAREFIQQMGFNHRSPDVLRPNGRGDSLELMPNQEVLVKYGLMLTPNFTSSKESLKRSFEGNSCLTGKIAITDNGDIIPCIFSRNKVMGSVLKNSSIEKVLKKQIDNVWKITKDDVLVCQDCEYRYACHDCRPISDGALGGKGDYATAPYPRCTYNPYEGEWGGGVWKVGENGKAYYDESLKSIIERIRVQRIEMKGGD